MRAHGREGRMGKRFAIVIGVAALGAAVMAAPAVAFDHHFTVVDNVKVKQVGAHLFLNKGKLFDPANRHDKVGRVRGLCREKPHKFKCHYRFHLNGEIGGFGNIKVKGDNDRGADHLVVIGGSRQFDGVAGKVTMHGEGKNHFDLVR